MLRFRFSFSLEEEERAVCLVAILPLFLSVGARDASNSLLNNVFSLPSPLAFLAFLSFPKGKKRNFLGDDWGGPIIRFPSLIYEKYIYFHN